MELPMAIGTVGGATRVHPGARLALEIVGTRVATELAMIMACVGLASNLAALRALATEGIQRGHMALHARTVALEAGATGELVAQVASDGDIRRVRAAAILAQLGAAHAVHTTAAPREAVTPVTAGTNGTSSRQGARP
jgi:hydroxymethylglutaryl-CoA reductase